MALTKLSTDSIDLSGNTTALTFPSGGTVDGNLNAVDFLIVAGGGGLGRADSGWYGGGGGGGGFRTSISSDGNGGGQSADNALSLSTGVAYTVTVGAGGSGGVGGTTKGTTGGDSSISGSGISTITSKGGGGGGAYDATGAGLDGGSGGGAGGNDQLNSGGAALTSPTTMGYAGGDHPAGSGTSGAGGGGAGSAGQDGAQGSGGGTGGAGGAAKASNITGSAVYYAAGGGGRYGYFGSVVNGAAGTNATGAANSGDGGTATSASGDGKAGIIILKYSSAFTATYSAGAGGSANAEVTIGNDKYIEITGGTGTVTFSGTEVIGRPGAPTEGILRDNVTTGALEFYNGSIWKKIRGTLVRACTTSTCNYPTTGTSLFQFEDNLNDTCGNYNITSSNNITYDSSGKFGKAADFSSSYADIPYTTFGEASCSISFWLYPHTTSGQHYFMTKYLTGSTNYGLLFQIYQNQWFFNYYDTGTSPYAPNLTYYSSASPNTWYHVVMTHELNTSVTYYINNQTNIGGTSSTFTPTGNPSVNSAPLRLGWYHTGSGYWDGLIDQVRIFDSCLTASQVSELYNEVGC